MVRTGIYSINSVLSKRNHLPKRKNEDAVDFDGDLVHMNSHRYHLFAEKGTCCVKCGAEGVYFAKERWEWDKRYHFNLYAIVDGKEVLMTKDHIIPKSKGGKDCLENYQTMCVVCNKEKGNKIE